MNSLAHHVRRPQLACSVARRVTDKVVAKLGVEVVAKGLEHRLYQTPRDVEFPLGPGDKPCRERHSIAAGRVPVCKLKIGPQIVHHHHDIGQRSGRKIPIHPCQCTWGPKPIPEALSLCYPWVRPASTGVWYVVQVYLCKGGTNHLAVVEAVVTTKGVYFIVIVSRRLQSGPAPIVPVHFARGSVWLKARHRI